MHWTQVEQTSLPRVRELLAISLKLLWWKAHAMSSSAHKTDSSGERREFTNFFSRNYIKTWNKKHWIENQCLVIPGVEWGESQFTENIFARICICPELYREVMFANPPPHGLGQLQNEIFCAKFEWKCPDVDQKLILSNPHLMSPVRVDGSIYKKKKNC